MDHRIQYETSHGTIGEGYVAEMWPSPLTDRWRVRICDTVSECSDPEAGTDRYLSDTWEVPTTHPSQTLSCFVGDN